MAEDELEDDEDLTEEDAQALLLASLANTIEKALIEEEEPLVLDEVKTTRSGRVVAYFDWDLEEEEDEDEGE